MSFYFSNYPAEDKIAGWLSYWVLICICAMSFVFVLVYLPLGSTDWSMISVCGMSWSYSLVFSRDVASSYRLQDG